LKRDEMVGVRGPFGSHWPMQEAVDHDVLLLAGGIGLAPLRPALYYLLTHRDRYRHIALLYGSAILWEDRPLFYGFSEDHLEMVQASALDATEIRLAQEQNPDFAPSWYRLPKWVWAPMPEDAPARAAIVASGGRVIRMPRYFKPWEQGLTELRNQLKPVQQLKIYSKAERQTLQERMTRLGLPPFQPTAMFLAGRGRPLVVVFDRDSLQIKTMIRVD
jgi:hypothetical protein